MSDDNILPFKHPKTKTEPPFKRKRPREERPLKCPGGCFDVLLDDKNQMCECQRCGHLQSPWQYLNLIMQMWEKIEDHTKHLRYERRSVTEQLDALKKEKTALQSSVRRLKLKGID